MSAVDATAARSVGVADVYKGGHLAARLRRDGGSVTFSYVAGYAGPPVATTLPVTDEPRVSAAGAVPPFFAGLLPEGRRLSNLRRLVKTSADDELSLLIAVGRDTIGDVVVVPEGVAPAPAPPVVVADTSFREVRFADLLADAGIVDPVALPGVQDKVSARVISLPVGTPEGRFILKLDPPEYPHVVENEAYFLSLARRAGLEVVDATVVRDADDRPGLLVRRFDRAVAGDDVMALACEDACQLLDRWPGDKYNVTAEAVADAVTSICAARPVAARDVFRQLCFAWLTANGDVHAKNISVLRHPTGEWRVSPAYDLPCTAFYGDRTLALSIAGAVDGLSRRKLVAFAHHIGLNDKTALRVIDGLLAATTALVDELVDGALPFDRAATTSTIKVLRFRRKLLAG